MDWSNILSLDDPSESVITLNNKLWPTFDKCFPMKKICLSSRDPPYMSPLVKYVLKMRHKLNNIQSQQEKVTLQEKINKLIRGNQIAAVKEENNRHKNGYKHWWNTSNKLTGRGQNTPVTNIISPDEINLYFQSINTDPDYSTPEQVEIPKGCRIPLSQNSFFL